jgi:electron transfer flavoprotein beta subunit
MEAFRMGYNIVVCIKQIIDIDQMKIDQNTLEPILKDLPYKIEDLSKNAVEEAVRIKEKHGGKVTGLIFGSDQATMAMKEALAMGADEGIIIKGYRGSNPKYTAAVLADKIKGLNADLIILGNESADAYTGQVPGRLSTLLKLPLLGNAVKLEVQERTVSLTALPNKGNAVKLEVQERTVKITKTLEDFNVIESATMPAIVSVEQEINEPRLPPLLQIMAAGRKPMKIEDTKINIEKSVEIISNKAPKSERKRKIYEDISNDLPEIAKIIKGEIK